MICPICFCACMHTQRLGIGTSTKGWLESNVCTELICAWKGNRYFGSKIGTFFYYKHLESHIFTQYAVYIYIFNFNILARHFIQLKPLTNQLLY